MTIAKSLLAAALLFAAPAITASASAQNLVVNGGFEDNDGYYATDWNGDGGYTDNYQGVHSGDYATYFGSIGSLAGISQDIATTAGQSYNVSFWFASDGGTPNAFQAWFGGTKLFDVQNAPFSGFTLESFNVTATSSLTALTFLGRNDPSYLMLDDVSVTANGTAPEPASWAMMLGGFGLIGGALRSRRKATVHFA